LVLFLLNAAKNCMDLKFVEGNVVDGLGVNILQADDSVIAQESLYSRATLSSIYT